jgi:protoporphyrin/coproporphyrin ferrochelatase
MADMRPYDALLVASFGGPEGPDDVMPFLENVTAGRGVPRERLAEVAQHYYHFGGVSPINGLNRDLVAAVRDELARSGLELPVYWGNRHWQPTLVDAIAAMRDDGVEHAIAFLTSAYASASGCRQYLDAIESARQQVGSGAPRIDRLRQYFNHPGFIVPVADAVRAALRELPEVLRRQVHLAFVAHSIPAAMQAASGPGGGLYVAQLTEAARLVAELVGGNHERSLSYCSRSGPPSAPWLEPDINDRLAEIAARDDPPAVVVVPIGFVSDHMEVAYDLDTEAAQTARALKLPFARAATAGTDPRFAAMVVELVKERQQQPGGAAEPRALGDMGPAHDSCPTDCCRMR